MTYEQIEKEFDELPIVIESETRDMGVKVPLWTGYFYFFSGMR